MHLYYTRHGQSEANAQKVYPPTETTPLTELGQTQARGAVAAAQAAGIARIIASDYPRAHQTATIIKTGLGLPDSAFASTPLLEEAHLGDLAGSPSNGMAGYLAALAAGNPTVEPVRMVQERLLSVLIHLPADDTPTLLVGHNLLFSIFEAMLAGTTPDHIPMRANASITQVAPDQLATLLS